MSPPCIVISRAPLTSAFDLVEQSVRLKSPLLHFESIWSILKEHRETQSSEMSYRG